jgi:hypothetical protein
LLQSDSIVTSPDGFDDDGVDDVAVAVVVCGRSVQERDSQTVVRQATDNRGGGIATERTTKACPDKESGQA